MEQNMNRAVESMVSAKPDYTGEIIAIIRSPISPSVMRERLEDYHEKDIAEVLPALTSLPSGKSCTVFWSRICSPTSWSVWRARRPALT